MKILNYAIVLAGLAAALALPGCTPPALNFTASNVVPSSVRFNAALLSINVAVASKNEATGKLNTAGAEADVASLWKASLDDAVVRMTIFRDDAPMKLSLIVKILEFDVRSLGYDTRVTARYELVDRNTGATVFKTDVVTTGSASDYVGNNRVRKSASRSVEANIEEFLKQLPAANIAKAP